MKKLIGLCFALTAGVQLLYAQAAGQKLQLRLSTGYQQENFHWSIAGNIGGHDPNVYSELRWKNLGGQDLAASVQWNVWKKVCLYADYSRLSVTSGKVNDSDYGDDNRTNNTYNETFGAGEGNTQALYSGIGYLLISNSRFSFAPYAGYGISRQSLHIIDGGGAFSSLNSTYLPNWSGPFLKAAGTVKLLKKLKFAADVTYNQVTYNSKANWNLITTFQHPVSYRHHANGYGLNAGGRFIYDITSHLSAHIEGSYFNWQTGAGTDELYLTSGQTDKTQMNGAFRNGFQVLAGLGFSL